MGKIYMCIDLKSFYASVECRERNLDPLKTNLVVADRSRTEKTICLAVSPSLKAYGIPGRARLFEVIQKVKEINRERRKRNGYKPFTGKSCDADELATHPEYELDFIAAPPRMKYYMRYSSYIYNIYLKYISEEDIFVYSIDEVFCDITHYLNYYQMSAKDLVTMIIKDVYDSTGITATSGIGTNLYLAKVAMDIVAKHAKPNEFGVRIALLNQSTYRKLLWSHRPLTAFWRVGPGYAKKLEENGMYTMGDVARKSLEDEDLLYSLFGVNAEILIDHAWGYEPTTMDLVKKYKPTTNSISSGQVLHCPYDFKKARIVIAEMIDNLSLDLVKKNKVTNQLVLNVGYDIENLSNPNLRKNYHGEIKMDHYGRFIPKQAHGTIKLDHRTSSSKLLIAKTLELFDRIVDGTLLIRRLNIAAINIVDAKEKDTHEKVVIEQFDLFTNYEEEDKKIKKREEEEKRENDLQKTLLNIKEKYGKNAILRGMNFEEGATARDRNRQVGGHAE